MKDIVFETSAISLRLSGKTGAVLSAKHKGYELVLPAAEPFSLQLLQKSGDQLLLKGSDFAKFEI